MTGLDIDRLRADTPGSNHVVHLNNAGASLPPQCVFDTVVAHLERERTMGGYEAQAAASEALNGFYTSLAALLNARPHEIAFVENATRAWDMAFYALPWQPGDCIVTGEMEYASNMLAFLQVARRFGVEIRVVPSTGGGQVDVSALEAMLDPRVKLIAITHVPSHTGVINPAAAIGQVARRHGVLYLLDACQSAGQLPLDVQAICCDMLSGTGRKFLRGPRGTGFLYVREDVIEILEPPFIDLQSATWTTPATYELRTDARRFETWEGFIAGRLGLARAVDYAHEVGLEAISTRIRSLGARLRAALQDIQGVLVRDPEDSDSGIVTFTKNGWDPANIVATLRAEGVNLSVSPASHARIDLDRRGLSGVLRASVHCYNTEDELDRLCERIIALRD